MKTIFKGILATFTAATAFAAQAAPQAPQPPMDPNPSARWGTNDKSNIFVTGEVVWFKPLQTQVAKNTTTDISGGDETYHLTMFKNNFQPAARVALGYNTSYDGWDAVLTYTGLRYKHNNSFVSTAYTEGDTGEFGSANYVIYYDQGDLDFGRMFKVSRKLKLRPHVGVRALWLTQKYSYNYEDTTGNAPTNYSDVLRTKSTLVGAEAGVDTAWMLSKEFCVYANLGFTTLVDSQKFHATGKNTDTNELYAAAKTNYGTKIVNGLDFAIGLRWDRNFSNGDYHFGINLGYEHHSLININTYNSHDIVLGTYELDMFDSYYLAMQDQDFSLQGIALGVRFDF
jgi:Legionella pneumophila major outer membrane protein precursor